MRKQHSFSKLPHLSTFGCQLSCGAGGYNLQTEYSVLWQLGVRKMTFLWLAVLGSKPEDIICFLLLLVTVRLKFSTLKSWMKIQPAYKSHIQSSFH